VEAYIAPAKGREHVLHLIHQILTLQPTAQYTDMRPALQLLMRLMKHTTVTFLFSDFHTTGFQRSMKTAAMRHDGIAIHLTDEKEWKLPAGALIPMQDAETGAIQWLDTWGKGFANAWKSFFVKEAGKMKTIITDQGWDYLRLHTQMDYLPMLRQFFNTRSKQMRRK
jgi:hypothetical protein